MSATGILSGVYAGTVFHRRTRPRAHFLKYSVFMLLLDLDEWDGLVRRLKWLGSGRFGLMTMRATDFGDRSETPLKTQIEARMGEAGIEGGGRIQLLTMPRILGYGFNPLSVFFCHAADGRLSAILYEVSNTFGARHSYLMPVGAATGPVRQAVDKAFHVSPFMDMDLAYRFAVTPPEGKPDEATSVAITVEDAEGPVLHTAFNARRSEITDRNLVRAWIGHPLLTLKVIAGIHWEAIRLIAKGLRLRGGTFPAHSVTIGGASENEPRGHHA
ncbi:DUF1365 domain-containing protein [soil metagenome]